MIATTQRKCTIASYGVAVAGALLLSKEDARALGDEAPGGIIERDGHVWRVHSIELEEQTSESGTVAVTLEPLSLLSA